MALFFGGPGVVLEKFEKWTPTDYALRISVVLLIVLHLVLIIYKRFHKKEMDYGARLRQQRVLGSQNLYKMAFLFISGLVHLFFLILHEVVTRNNTKVSQCFPLSLPWQGEPDTFGVMIGAGFCGSFCIYFNVWSFIQNQALR